MANMTWHRSARSPIKWREYVVENSHQLSLRKDALKLIKKPTPDHSEVTVLQTIIKPTLLTPSILLAYELLTPHIPFGSKLEIREVNSPNSFPYELSIIYVSHKTNRSIRVSMKSEVLPSKPNNLRFYTHQIVLSPSEISRRFSMITRQEKIARQQAFLSEGKGSKIRVSDVEAQKDLTEYSDDTLTYISNRKETA